MKTTASLLLVLMFLSGSPLAWADKKLAEKVDSVRVSLSQAIVTAEAAVNGKTYKAKLDDNSFGLEYEIEMLVDGKRVEVSVDANTNQVIKIRHKKN